MATRGSRLTLVPSSATARSPSTLLAIASVAALLWVLAARIVGPSDSFDQTQPRTMSYTTDIIVNGRWILPIERGEHPATKPPLYNWLAVPAVAVAGFSSDLAHKLPSIVAACLTFVAVVVLGRRLALAAAAPTALGWAAGLMVAANYSVFKLAYLARPDMLLVLWLTLGWMSATGLVVTTSARRVPLAVAFWICVALAAFTKGPAAIVLPLYALLAARCIGGRWSTARSFGWWWGLPLAAGLFAAWVGAVYRIDPEHVRHQLWFEELYGRVTGLGGEGTGRGPIELLRRILHLPAYYVMRFAPWSLLAVAALWRLWSRADDGRSRRWRQVAPPLGAWLHGAGIYTLVVVVLFSITAGKRADYVVAAFPPGALLAGWLLVTRWPAWSPAAVTAAGLALGVMTLYDQRELG
ncbi:MAG: ArnT family glycosyltransferase, partial [Planctomycetota bacterium]